MTVSSYWISRLMTRQSNRVPQTQHIHCVDFEVGKLHVPTGDDGCHVAQGVGGDGQLRVVDCGHGVDSLCRQVDSDEISSTGHRVASLFVHQLDFCLELVLAQEMCVH